MTDGNSSINRTVPLFRTPGGGFQPASVDNLGRLQASIFPFADPDNSFALFDGPASNNIPSISLTGQPGIRRVITGVYFSMAQGDNATGTDQWSVRLIDSISGNLWGGEVWLPVTGSITIGFSDAFIFGQVGSDISVTVTRITVLSTAPFQMSMSLFGFNFGA